MNADSTLGTQAGTLILDQNGPSMTQEDCNITLIRGSVLAEDAGRCIYSVTSTGQVQPTGGVNIHAEFQKFHAKYSWVNDLVTVGSTKTNTLG